MVFTGPDVGNKNTAILSVSSTDSSPALITNPYWKIQVTRKKWVNVPDVKCVCARFNMERCTSGLRSKQI